MRRCIRWHYNSQVALELQRRCESIELLNGFRINYDLNTSGLDCHWYCIWQRVSRRAMFDSPGQASFQVMFLPATLVSYVRRATPPDFRHTHT